MEKSFFDFKLFLAPNIDQIEVKTTGACQKNILILCGGDVSDDLTIFLHKIIAAVKLNLETDCLTWFTGNTQRLPNLTTLQSAHPFEKVLIFGIAPPQLGMKITPVLYAPFHLNGLHFLFVEDLKLISTSEERKRALWQALKGMF